MFDKPRYNGQVDGYPISDIQSSNGISRSREPATDTRKKVSIRSIQFGNGMAMRTFLRSISRVNINEPYTGKVGFVFNKIPELVETPRVVSASLRLSNGCPLPDTSQIFNGNQGFGVFCLSDNLLRDTVVNVPVESSLTFPDLLQMAFRRLRSDPLKCRSDRSSPFTNVINLLAREYFSGAIGGNVDNTKINTKNILRDDHRVRRSINNNGDKELPVSVDKVSLTTNLFVVKGSVFTNFYREFQSAIQGCYRDTIKSFPRKVSLVIHDSTFGFESGLDAPVPLVYFSNLRNHTDCHLCRKVVSLLYGVIHFLLQLDFIGGVRMKSNFSNLVTSSVKLMHGLDESFRFFIRSFKLDKHGLHHCIECRTQWIIRLSVGKKDGIPPLTKVKGFLPEGS